MAEARVERRLAAILAADIAGYSRIMGTDEVGTLAALKAHRRDVVDPAIAAHKGRIVKTTGDGMLVEFASAVDAVTCAVAVQEKMAERTAEGTEPRIQFRMGLNVGDIIIDGGDIFGDGVNVAARVENECEPGGVCLSDDAYRQVRGKLDGGSTSAPGPAHRFFFIQPRLTQTQVGWPFRRTHRLSLNIWSTTSSVFLDIQGPQLLASISWSAFSLLSLRRRIYRSMSARLLQPGIGNFGQTSSPTFWAVAACGRIRTEANRRRRKRLIM